jgi:predicted dehydrogenase
LTVKRLIKDGVLGDIIDFETHFDWDDPGWPSNWANVKEYMPGKGTLFGLGSHTADQVLSLFGPPESVFAVFRAHRDGSRGSAIDDWHALLLQYAAEENKGMVVTIRSTQISPMSKQLSFLVRGRQGSYIKVSLLHTA